MLKQLFTVSTAVGFLAGISSLAFAESTSPWTSPHYIHHVLVGKIWSTKEQKMISRKDLKRQIGLARFVLLGETHSNKDHHLRQSYLMLAAKGTGENRPSLIVEMIPKSLGGVFEKHIDRHGNISGKLGKALKWEQRGWGKWSLYRKIFARAASHQMPVVAGNIDRADIKHLGRQGLSAISATQKTEWSLDFAYTPAQKAIMSELLFESHCKFVPKTALAPMRLIQQARDGFMARAMVDTPKSAAAVLIAGAGHVRRDIGAPRVLRKLEPGAKTISIAFTEVSPDQKKPSDYEPKSADNKPVFDYMYFTPKSEIKDHCAELAKRFKKKKVTK